MKKILVAVLLMVSPAFAADEPRKIDFTTVLLDPDDKPLTECADDPLPKEMRDCIARRPITLGLVALGALSMFEQGLAPEEVAKRGALGLELYKATAAALTPEDIVLLKKQIAKRYTPLMAIRAFRLIDPTTK